ncbi:MAG: hypothetical protein ABWX94_01495 [Candidatus Saccharimonadales bacterium]
MSVDFSMIQQKIMAAAVNIDSLPKPAADQPRLQLILTTVFTITGAIALLVVAIGGLRYVLSHGDPSSTAQAKNMILYALIGLTVSIIAVSIVAFVIGRVA